MVSQTREQAIRCMDCGTPFCHWGCPLGNFIPEWNDAVRNLNWRRAYELLSATNILPEVTGRICPALCESACVLGINDDPVTVRKNELDIIEHAFKKGWVQPTPPQKRTKKKIAIVGSGPAGLACAVRLNQFGNNVTVFEKDDKIGGLLRYGIPAFKLDKALLDRRIALWEQEGIEFKINSPVNKRLEKFDAMVLAGGCRAPRDLNIPGRDLQGVYFALEYLTQSINVKGKKVVVIGGGDTGADCVHMAQRQGAKSIAQLEILPKPPLTRPWPWFMRLYQEEKVDTRLFSVATKGFKGLKGQGIKGLECVKVDHCCKEIPGTEFSLEAEVVILALGFIHPERKGILTDLGIELDGRGNVKTDKNYMTSSPGIFAAGDMRRGQSLIVWALYEGREAAEKINES